MTAPTWPKYYLPVGRVGGPPSSTWTRAPTTHAAAGAAPARITSEDRQARHRVPSGRLGRHRYVVEGSLAWLVGCPRVQVRDERHADILLGFVHLACALAATRP